MWVRTPPVKSTLRVSMAPPAAMMAGKSRTGIRCQGRKRQAAPARRATRVMAHSAE